MKCKLCDQHLVIKGGKLHSEEGSTDVYNTTEYACVNPRCDLYAGIDLNSPEAKVADVKTQKVN